MTRTITREQFQAAIEAGLTFAARLGDPLTDDESAALRAVGQTATRVHTNATGCPAVLAGLYDPNASVADPGYLQQVRILAFIWGYDEYLFAPPAPVLTFEGTDGREFWFEVTE